jgi:hypothetical protein
VIYQTRESIRAGYTAITGCPLGYTPLTTLGAPPRSQQCRAEAGCNPDFCNYLEHYEESFCSGGDCGSKMCVDKYNEDIAGNPVANFDVPHLTMWTRAFFEVSYFFNIRATF